MLNAKNRNNHLAMADSPMEQLPPHPFPLLSPLFSHFLHLHLLDLNSGVFWCNKPKIVRAISIKYTHTWMRLCYTIWFNLMPSVCQCLPSSPVALHYGQISHFSDINPYSRQRFQAFLISHKYLKLWINIIK